MAVPAAMPTPVTAVPAPMTPVPVMPPVDFFGFQAIDIVLRDDRGLRAFAPPRHEALLRRNRWQRRGVHARSKCCSSGGYAKGEFQKMTAFHDISLFVRGE
jgi:hypothetical protein